MRNENGYVLLIVLVVVCAMTLTIISLTNRTTQASFLAAKRAAAVQAFSLAENAASEGYWRLSVQPTYRTSQERHWGRAWYRFSIIDPTPLTADDDMDLEVLGEGFSGTQRRRVRLVLTRLDMNSDFVIDSWQEDN
mgnify:CR=1 FL=1